MDSLFNKSNELTETNNTLYNIINFSNPKTLFTFCVIIIFSIFVSTVVQTNINTIICLLLGWIVVYYIYTYNKYQTLSDKQIENEKFQKICPSNNILKEYPKIIDLLYYMSHLKIPSIRLYDSIVELFEKFCNMYESCVINPSLIFANFQSMVDVKIKILVCINSFVFTSDAIEYDPLLHKQIESTQGVLNEMLEQLVILGKKKLYYDGYSTQVVNLPSTNVVLPFNVLDGVSHTKTWNEGGAMYEVAGLLNF